jgi:hypothetical protein
MEHFRNKLVRGKAIGAQKHFAHNFNRVMLILENIKGVGGIVIKKEGIDWRITYEPTLTVQTPAAWDLTIDGDTATCVNCMLMLSTVTVMAAGDQMQLTCALTGHSAGWLCGVINGSTKEVSLDFREPTTEMNEEQDEIVFPLYRVIKEGGVWRVAVDVRAMPRIGAYW